MSPPLFFISPIGPIRLICPIFPPPGLIIPSVDEKLIPDHGGYQNLAAYQMAEIVHDATVAFTNLYLDKRSRTIDQMVQAARSGKQNIAEGSMASGTSKEDRAKAHRRGQRQPGRTPSRLQRFPKTKRSRTWPKDHEKAIFIRKLSYRPNRSYKTYRTYLEEKGPANAANTMVCVDPPKPTSSSTAPPSTRTGVQRRRRLHRKTLSRPYRLQKTSTITTCVAFVPCRLF